MQLIITALGPDNTGLVAPIVQTVTGAGGNIAEIQMYDHDEAADFAMYLRAGWPGDVTALSDLREGLQAVGRSKGLDVRVWSQAERMGKPRVALCTTYRTECPQRLLEAMADGRLNAEPAVVIGNRRRCQALAEAHGVPFVNIGDAKGVPDNERFVAELDAHDVDFVVLARYMRLIPPHLCWAYAGGRIVNLHHGLLPPFPGFRPYHDAFQRRMLTYGATAHFIVPELDAGDQTVFQDTFSVAPGTQLDEIIGHGERVNEPAVLLEGLRRVVDGEVALHFHKVVARKPAARSPV